MKNLRLRAARAAKGLSQQALAKAAGVHKRNVQEWEKKGIEHAVVENALKVAKALGCTIDDLLGP